ncbi:MAG: DEAD/DEAH box helicase family protein, partial [Chthoniobacterales bacterium]|nr:DEAD/DEAH box helicase family protein [Chthoniobacterales bacterium]
MPRFAKVIVDSYLDKALDYEIPSHLSTTIGIGSRVRVPLRNRSVLGIVTGFADHSDVPNIRPIQAVLGERPLVPPILLKLAEWMSNYYLCSLDAAIRTVLPYAVRNEKIRQKTTKFLKLRRSFTNHELDVLAKRSPRQAQILRILSNQPNCQIEIRKLEEEIGKAGQHLRRLSAAGFVEIFEQAVNRDPYANQNFLQDTPRTLNPAQQKAFLSALEAIANPASSRPLLLHGVTGSGKTEVYLQLVQHVLNIGKSAIILIPEISLAPQTVERFKSRFSPIQNQIAVLHSNLSEGQRHDEWFKVL